MGKITQEIHELFGEMRQLTKEEQKERLEALLRISKPTDRNFFDILERGKMIRQELDDDIENIADDQSEKELVKITVETIMLAESMFDFECTMHDIMESYGGNWSFNSTKKITKEDLKNLGYIKEPGSE